MRTVSAALDSLLAAGLVVRASGAAHSQAKAQGAPDAVVSFGLAAIDEALPDGGLARAALHELAADPGDAASRALAAIIAGRAGGPVFWIQLARDVQEGGQVYPYGLAALGLDPDRVFAITAATAQDALWAMEEALRAGCAGAVIGDGLAPDLTASRRLLLAAESGSGPALIVRDAVVDAGVGAGLAPPSCRESNATSVLAADTAGRGKPRPYNTSVDRATTRAKHSSAALTIWRIASAASAEDVGPGAPRWDITLVRCRGGRVPRSWLVEWNGAQLTAPSKPARVASRPAETARRTG